MSDFLADGGANRVEAALALLSQTGHEQQITLHTDISGRTQTVFLVQSQAGGSAAAHTIAYSRIADDSAVHESDLLEWSARHPAIQFRSLDGCAVAYTVVTASTSQETCQRNLERLARIADRLEYELAEGDDSH